MILDKAKIYSSKDIAGIQNTILTGVNGILDCRTREAVEASITYGRFLNKTGITIENYPLFIKVIEVGNHWVIDALIGDRDPFLLLSPIQPNDKILSACFSLLAERHPGGIYYKSLSVILGVLQASYKIPADGYKIYAPSISDVNAIGKHLDEETGQEDSLNRVILDILEKIANLEGLKAETPDIEELAIHSNEIRNHFYDDTKRLDQVIPPVLLVRMNYQDFEIVPRSEVAFDSGGDSILSGDESAHVDASTIRVPTGSQQIEKTEK